MDSTCRRIAAREWVEGCVAQRGAAFRNLNAMINALQRYWYDEDRVSQGPEFVHFECKALDPDAVIWQLRVAPTGSISLQYDDLVVSQMSALDSLALLKSEGTPAQVAEDIVTTLTARLAVAMHEHARMSLESDFSRWIAENF